jgi:glucose-6-phosphate 1-dehydrogenase
MSMPGTQSTQSTHRAQSAQSMQTAAGPVTEAGVAKAPPHLFVIFGGTGDLTARKLLPAIHELVRLGHLGDDVCFLAVARSGEHDDTSYRRWVRRMLGEGGVEVDAAWCDRCLHYVSLGKGTGEDFERVGARIAELDRERRLGGNRVFYLALPAPGVAPTVEGLGAAGLASSDGWSRLVIEKPFGHDLESASALNALIHRHFAEEKVYRIDHYLGKETVQNLLVLRFGNTVFEDLWNRDRIESVQITASESLGVEGRAGFYETAGALRDVLQNHLLQVMALTAMEIPMTFSAGDVSGEKLKVLRAVQTPGPEDVVWGRYTAGRLDGHAVPGYLEEPGVSSDSQTETYVALRVRLNSWRWQGVPFYLRTGKRMDRKLTQIVITFRRPPICLFESMGSCLLHGTDLKIVLQPQESFSLNIDVKAPGEPLTLQRIPLRFAYADAFGKLPDAYETLLLDIMEGDRTLFVHADETEAAWRICDPLLSVPRTVHDYRAGSHGPAAADALLGQDGCRWSDG